MLEFVDMSLIVTPQLAESLVKIYGKPYQYIPNAERNIPKYKKIVPAYMKKSKNKNVKFLYLGNYAIGRGLELLIENWNKTQSNAHLYFRGPEWTYTETLKELAKKKNLLNKRIFFLNKVDHNLLVKAASEADVGIIPYEPEVGMNNKFCCSGKLSQYMVAGLPIISNELPHVADILTQAKCGYAVNFHNQDDFVSQVNLLSSNNELRMKLGKNARKFFFEHFNWDKLSSGTITKICQGANNKSVQLYTNKVIATIGAYFANINESIESTGTSVRPTPTTTTNNISNYVKTKPLLAINRNLYNAGYVLTKSVLTLFPLEIQNKVKNVLKSRIIVSIDDHAKKNTAVINRHFLNIKDNLLKFIFSPFSLFGTKKPLKRKIRKKRALN